MPLELSDIDFQIPELVVHHFYVTGSLAVLVNCFVFYLIIFRNERMDSFRFYMLSFQASTLVLYIKTTPFILQFACSLVDMHLSFAMQPIPLFPIRAGHCAGFGSTLLGVSSHSLMVVLTLLLGFQVNTLTICFLRKHQGISKIDRKHVLSRPVFILLVILFITYPFSYTTSFYFSKSTKEEQFQIIERDYPLFRSQFEQMPEFALYEMNPRFLGFLLLIIGGCLQSIATVTLLVFQMYTTLINCRRNLSKATLEKHKTALKSLVIQFLTTPIVILPAMLILLTVFIPFKGAQVFTWYMLMLMATHSTINSFVVIFTFPEFREFVIFWNRKNRRQRNGQSISIVHDISGNNRFN